MDTDKTKNCLHLCPSVFICGWNFFRLPVILSRQRANNLGNGVFSSIPPVTKSSGPFTGLRDRSAGLSGRAAGGSGRSAGSSEPPAGFRERFPPRRRRAAGRRERTAGWGERFPCRRERSPSRGLRAAEFSCSAMGLLCFSASLFLCVTLLDGSKNGRREAEKQRKGEGKTQSER